MVSKSNSFIKKLTSKFTRINKRYPITAKVLSVTLIAIIGIATLLISQAATFSISLEPELASTKTGVTTPTDATASGNSYVQFGAGTTTPPSGDFPDATNTGFVGAGLTEADLTPLQNGQISGLEKNQWGDWEARTAGVTIDKKDINGCVYILAKNITIKRSRIRCYSGSGYSLDNKAGNLTVEYTEITKPDTSKSVIYDGEESIESSYAIRSGPDSIYRYLYIHGQGSGIHLSGAYVASTGNLIEHNFIGDLVLFTDRNVPSNSSHNDAILGNGGYSNTTIRHNTLLVRFNQTGPLALYIEGGAISNVLVENNLVAGGGICVYSPTDNASSSNIKFLNNKFSTRYWPNCGATGLIFAPVRSGNGNEWTGNTWIDGPRAGQPAN